MSDLKRELTEALAREGEAAPSAGGLAEAARRRAGVRRTRRRGALAVVAAVVVVAGATVAVHLGGGGGPRPADTSPTLDPDGDGWRTVTRGAATFEVPAAWTDEEIVGPCVQNDPCSTGPDRRDARVFLLEPLDGQRGGFGMDVAPAEDDEGWWASSWLDAGYQLTVRGDSRAEVQRVVDTAHGGCAPTADFSAVLSAEPMLDQAVAQTAVICEYGSARWDRLPLVAQREVPAGPLLQALEAAPQTREAVYRCVTPPRGSAVRVRLGSVEVWVNDDTMPCTQSAVYDGSSMRVITDDVRAALTETPEWRTVVDRGVEFEIPGDWVAHDVSRCDFAIDVAVYAPAGIDACRQDVPMARITDVSMVDLLCESTLAQDEGGWWTGCRIFRVGRTDYSLSVRADEAVARRILDSARREQSAWRTVTFRGVDVDIPATWVPVGGECRFRAYAAPTATCDDGEGLAVYGNSTVTYAYFPGVRTQEDFPDPLPSRFTGHVTLDDVDVSVDAGSRELALRILASAREAGEAAPDLSGGFEPRTVDGVTFDVPSTADVELKLLRGIIDGVPGSVGVDRHGPSGRWRGSHLIDDTHLAYAYSTSRALALMVASTARLR